ncbi:MAG: flagellar biosynthesis protein FliQ [Gammaproteobacteria bacterium]|nr:flagellar biosynthesis protein FliQ [Gammaproteobacteria bacterium]
MTPETVTTIGRHALELTIVLMLIMVVPSLIAGLMISIFQAATQINEMTLSFIPKLIATVLVMLLAGPYLLQLITGFTLELYSSIPELIG